MLYYFGDAVSHGKRYPFESNSIWRDASLLINSLREGACN